MVEIKIPPQAIKVGDAYLCTPVVAQEFINHIRPQLNVSADIASVVIKEACTFWDMDYQELTSSLRTRSASVRRWMVFRLLSDYGFSSVAIGRLMDRDHGTVLNGLGKITSWINTYPAIGRDFKQLKKLVKLKLAPEAEVNGKVTNDMDQYERK